MSDYELIMIILEAMTVVIAFGALVALILSWKRQIALRYPLDN